MKNKLLALTLCLLTLSGCSLADPDLGEAKLPDSLPQQPDPLVGVVITREHLDLWDPMTGDQKLYAVPGEDGRMEFDLPGSISFFTYEYDHPAGRTTAVANTGVSGAGPHIKSTDEGESVELTGTLYVPESSGTICFYFNPVYQAEDDSLYLMAGQGTALSGDNGEGMSFSHDMSATETITVNGKKQTRSCSVKVTAEVVSVPTEIRMLHMDAAGNLIFTQSWQPGQVPEHVALHRDCAWAVLEQVKPEYADRTLYNFGDKYAESFYPEDGLVKIQSTELLWPKK